MATNFFIQNVVHEIFFFEKLNPEIECGFNADTQSKETLDDTSGADGVKRLCWYIEDKDSVAGLRAGGGVAAKDLQSKYLAVVADKGKRISWLPPYH